MAVGTELLLGQIADTNSAWLGEHLAANGVASHFHQAVGDNHDRITLALRTALARSDGVIMCGGLGPDPGRHHPRGHRRGHERRRSCATRRSSTSSPASSRPGAAPCRRTTRARPTCRRAPPSSRRWPAPRPASSARSATRSSTPSPASPTRWPRCSSAASCPTCAPAWPRSGEESGVIASRVLRTWGASESGLAESLQDRIDALDATGDVDARLPGLGHRGHQGAHHRAGPHARRRHRAARQGGGRGPPRHRGAPRRHRVRRRRRVDGGRGGRPASSPGA